MNIKHLLIGLMLCSSQLKGQEIKYTIKGEIKTKPKEVYYAYMVRKGEIFEKSAIINGSFSFEGKTNLGDDEFKSVYIITDKSATITLTELLSKEKNQLWIPGRDENTRTVVLEEISLIADSVQNIRDAAIIAGGIKTLKVDERTRALKENKLPEFIKANPNSMLSLGALEQLIKYYRLAPERAERAFGNIQEMYNVLTENLKQTERGKLLKKQIDELN